MAKATVQEMTDRGWRPDQFGGPADWDQPGGYLDRVLAAAGTWARHELGAAVYDLVTAGYAWQATVNAELAHADAELWRRRLAYLDSAANIGHQEGPAALMRQMSAQLAGARECAVYWIGEAQRATGQAAATPGSGFAIGHVETGRWPAASSTRLN